MTNRERIERLRCELEYDSISPANVAAALAVIEKWEKELSAIAESGSICNKWAQRQLALLDVETRQ